MFRMLESANGDCFEIHSRFISNSIIGYNRKDIKYEPGWTLVQGVVTGSPDTEVDGIRFGHSWMEKDNMVWDISNGRDIKLPKDLYYKLGNIKEQECYKYDEAQTRANILKYGHWGSWEFDGGVQ